MKRPEKWYLLTVLITNPPIALSSSKNNMTRRALCGHLNALSGRQAVLHLNVLGRSQRLLAISAHVREVNARVEEDEQECGDEDEGAVEDKEAGLVLHDSVAPAAGHFSDTVIRCTLVICSNVKVYLERKSYR